MPLNPVSSGLGGSPRAAPVPPQAAASSHQSTQSISRDSPSATSPSNMWVALFLKKTIVFKNPKNLSPLLSPILAYVLLIEHPCHLLSNTEFWKTKYRGENILHYLLFQTSLALYLFICLCKSEKHLHSFFSVIVCFQFTK